VDAGIVFLTVISLTTDFSLSYLFHYDIVIKSIKVCPKGVITYIFQRHSLFLAYFP
jgi:hypothetical protein